MDPLLSKQSSSCDALRFHTQFYLSEAWRSVCAAAHWAVSFQAGWGSSSQQPGGSSQAVWLERSTCGWAAALGVTPGRAAAQPIDCQEEEEEWR